jgi:hypothetical protein
VLHLSRASRIKLFKLVAKSVSIEEVFANGLVERGRYDDLIASYGIITGFTRLGKFRIAASTPIFLTTHKVSSDSLSSSEITAGYLDVKDDILMSSVIGWVG